jgi:uncharacterized damage-inducible protein DinB
MLYKLVAIPDEQVPQAADPLFQHLVTTYASETNKTASMWRAVPDDLLDYKPHEKVNTIPAILVHQILSERRFFAQFVGTVEPPVKELLPPGDRPPVQAYLDKHVGLAKRRLSQLAEASAGWWLGEMPFFGGLRRQRIWTFWRVLHTCHHRTQVQTWLRLAGRHVPGIYGPSGDVTWEEADPTCSVEAADRGHDVRMCSPTGLWGRTALSRESQGFTLALVSRLQSSRSLSHSGWVCGSVRSIEAAWREAGSSRWLSGAATPMAWTSTPSMNLCKSSASAAMLS